MFGCWVQIVDRHFLLSVVAVGSWCWLLLVGVGYRSLLPLSVPSSDSNDGKLSLAFFSMLIPSRTSTLSSVMSYSYTCFSGLQSTHIYKGAVSGVFRTSDPPPRPPPAPKGGGVHTRRAVRGWGVNILEDARNWIGLLQYSIIPLRSDRTEQKHSSLPTLYRRNLNACCMKL